MRFELITREARRSILRFARGGTQTLAAVLTTALAVSSATAFLGMAGRIWFSPIQVENLDRLVVPRLTRTVNDTRVVTTTMRYTDFQRLSQLTSFESVAASAMLGRFPLVGEASSTTVAVTFISPDYFRTLSVPVRRGPGLSPERSGSARPIEVVLSHDVWLRHFSSESTTEGAWRLSGVPIRVVGVAPPGFAGTALGLGQDHIFAPLRSAGSLAQPANYFGESRNPAESSVPWLTMVARIRPGLTVREVSEEVSRITAESESSQSTGEVIPLLSAVVPAAMLTDLKVFGSLIASASVILLIIGSVHVGSILLTSGTERLGELRVRSALGARPRDLMALLMGHNVLLVGLSSVIGLLGSRLWLSALAEYELPGNVQVSQLGSPLTPPIFWAWLVSTVVTLGGAVLGSAVVLSRGVFSILPRAHVSKSDSRGSVILATQVVLSVVLVFAAVRFSQAARVTLDIPPGFVADGLVAGTVDPARRLGREQLEGHLRRLSVAVRSVSGVSSVAVGPPPINGYNLSTRSVTIGSRSVDLTPSMVVSLVGDNYFQTLQQPVLIGSGVVPGPRSPESPIPGWLNASAAARLFPGRSPVGELMTVAGIEHPVEVVGVVGNVKYLQLREPERAGLYLPYWTAKTPVLTALIVRVAPGLESAVASAIQKAAFDANPDVPVEGLRSAIRRLNELAAPQRFGFWLLSMFAGLAVALTAAGVYAVLVGSLKREHRDIAIRLACGATPRRIAMDMLWRRRAPLACGVLVGLGAMPIVDRALTRFSYDAPGSLKAAIAAECVVGLVFLASAGIRVRRTLKVSPRDLLCQTE